MITSTLVCGVQNGRISCVFVRSMFVDSICCCCCCCCFWCCVAVCCSCSISIFGCFDISKMSGFTFQLYFNRTSICYNIIEWCMCTPASAYDQQYDTFKVIWSGAIQSRETNVKQQKQRCCQNWWFLSPSPVLITFILSLSLGMCVLLLLLPFSTAMTYHTHRWNTQTTFQKYFAFMHRDMCKFRILLETERSLHSAFQLPFFFVSFFLLRSTRFSWSHPFAFSVLCFASFTITVVYFSGLSIPFHFGTFLIHFLLLLLLNPILKQQHGPNVFVTMCVCV